MKLFVKRVMGTVCAGALVFGLSACGSDDEASDTTTTSMDMTTATTAATTATTAASSGQVMSGTAEVPIQNFAFTPSTITVKSGTKVTWTNKDSVMHTVTSGANRTPDGTFDKTVQPGETYSFTFNTPGTYDYYCKPHEKMVAKVIVVS